MKYIVAILIFTLIIMFHEWGHFLLARKNGIVVEEFCLGFGPDIISKKVGDTKYSIKLFWLGGACMMKGEEGNFNEDEDETQDAEIRPIDEEGSFQSKGVWARMSVVFAGPFFNFILAFLLSLILIGMIGYDAPYLAAVDDGSPAQESGLMAGDCIYSINGKRIHVRREALLYTYFHPNAVNKPMEIVYVRDGVRYTTSLTPVEMTDENGETVYRIGIVFFNARIKANGIEWIAYSFHEVHYWIETTISSLKMLVIGKVQTTDLSGPVGIVKTIGDTYVESKENGGYFLVIANLLNISILLTANLGVMNLLPLPALDGGRLLFLLVEAIRRKKVDPEKEGLVHMIGFALLMTLMIFILFNDVKNIMVG